MSDMKTYGQLDAQLREIMDRIERAEYDELEAMLKDYDAGMKLIEQMKKQLESAKNSIKKVK